MNQVAVTIKIDADLKQDVQQLGKSLGLSFSAIAENKLRQAVRERRIVFEENLTPNAKTQKILNQIEDDVQHNRNISKPFNSFEELEKHLNSL